MWNRLSGFKTFIGGMLHAVWFAIYVYGNITGDYEIENNIQIRGHIVIGVWTGIGLWDKYNKNKDKINEGINNAKKRILNK